MDDEGNEFDGEDLIDEEYAESENDDEDEAILHEKKDSSSPRENI